MNLALLGLDDQTASVVRAARAGMRDHVVALSEISPDNLSRLDPLGVRSLKVLPWESLLDEAALGIDVVVVAAADATEVARTARAEQLTRLVQAGLPLLISHPVLSSMLACYELEMVREETRSVMVPYLPARWNPLVERLIELLRAVADSPIGTIQQVVFERSAVQRDRASVLAHFARDVDLIRHVCGDIARVGALGSTADPAAYANLAVQLSGPETLSTRWSIGPVIDAAGARATFIGERGRLILQMPDEASWQLEIHAGDGAPPEMVNFGDWEPGAAALQQVSLAMERRAAAEKSLEGQQAGESQSTGAWNDAARDVELAETVDRSLLRGRTIEVHREELSEAGTFKGLMTSLGCGLLLLTIFLIFALEVAGKAARAARWQWLAAALRTWPLILLGVLVLFLLLQFLLKAAGPRDNDRG
jgi:myo-inositol 2-dehydrogenase/D-chiro-inositol 1-dehydrogenase